ncbi:hypothetical protein TorRG33x02_008930 [Trema orientale]|uniref:25S rRNA (uridine-N(3))-methyltransferase BMT5-like domain-containing protein n=1 Tax=Trema orientale TaxID=63057 RepID=A0A2P5G0V0_TREOI|nr:hypothetical protein TorRG33x02_008930 [Trema orientale]
MAHLDSQHRRLVHQFFWNARSMLRPNNGEIHVTHKTKPPFCYWNLEELATWNSLVLIECVDFNIEDYPGYKNKRGDGAKCDRPFPLETSNMLPGRTSNHHLHMLPESGQRTGYDVGYGFNRDIITGRTLNHDMHKLPEIDRTEIRRLIEHYGN